MMSVHLSEVSIWDTYGIRCLELQPKTVTLITGANGTGKSSLINALAYLFGGGSDPAVIRAGAKKSVVSIAFTNGQNFRKTTTPSGYKLEGYGPDGLAIPSPQKALNELADAGAVSPAGLLVLDARSAAGRKALAAALLEAMPLAITADDLAAAVPRAELLPGAPPVPHLLDAVRQVTAGQPGPWDLGGIAKLRKAVEETRRAVGASVRDAEGTVKSLSAALLSDEEAAEAVEAHRQAVDALAELKESEDEGVKNIKDAAEIERAGIKGDETRLKDEAHARYQSELRKIQSDTFSKLADLVELEEARITEIRSANRAAREHLTGMVAELKERAAAAERAKGARETVDRIREKLAADSSRYDDLSAVLQAIDEAKRQKLAECPVDGLEVTADSVTVGGVPWHALNLAQRATLAVQIASMRGGAAALMLLDDAEHLDRDSWAALKGALVEAGYQIIATRVESGAPLTVKTEEAA